MLKLTDIARLDGWEEGYREGVASAATEGHGDGLCVSIKLYWVAVQPGTQTTHETADSSTQNDDNLHRRRCYTNGTQR